MAIATSYTNTDKNALLEKINALVWALQYLAATGVLPSKEYLALKYPTLSREKLLWHLGCKSEDEVKAKLGELRLKFEGLQQTLIQEINTPEEIRQIPQEIIQSGIFAGKEEEEAKKNIQSLLSDLQKEPTDADLKLIEPGERRTIQATLSDPHASFSPTYNQAAEILAQVGLIDENGEPKPEYQNLLANPEFKKEVEGKIRKAILAQDLETQIIAGLDEKFASLDIPQETIRKEFNFAKKQIAARYAQEALGQLLAAGNDTASISNANQAAKRAISAQIEKDKEFLPRFFDSLLAANPKLENDGILRREITAKLTNASFEALDTLGLTQNIEVHLGDDLPRITAAHYFVDDRGELKRDLHDYWILPKTPEALNEEVEEERNDQEVLLAALYKETSNMPNPNIGKYVGTERPEPKKLWPYYVSAPLFAGWFITDPSEAISVIPYGATAIATYIGAGQINEKVKTFKAKIQPFVNPGEYLRKKYSMAVRELLFQKIPAKALRMTPLYKNYDIKGPDGIIYKHSEFIPARFLRTGTAKALGKLAGDKPGSIRNKVFTKAKENITPRVNLRTKKVEKEHNGLLGVIIGVALVDILAGAILEYIKDKVVMFAKIERALGSTGRIGKSAFSLNTAAGVYAGLLIGTPLGLATPLAVIGGLGGWGLQTAKDFAKDQGFLIRQTQREQLLAEGKLFSRWERIVTRIGRIPRLFNQNPPISNIPLKGVVFGYMVGGVPGAITWGSVQILWSNRAWMGSQFTKAVNKFVFKASGKKYTNLNYFLETGVNKWPLWQRVPIKALAEFRYVGRWAPGASAGGAIGFIASGGNPLGAAAGVLIGGTAQIITAFLTRTTISLLSSAWEKYVLHNLRMLYARYPWMRYSLGGTAGIGIGFLLASLGIPLWLAIPAGIGAGIAAQRIIELVFGLFGKGEGFGAFLGQFNKITGGIANILLGTEIERSGAIPFIGWKPPGPWGILVRLGGAALIVGGLVQLFGLPGLIIAAIYIPVDFLLWWFTGRGILEWAWEGVKTGYHYLQKLPWWAQLAIPSFGVWVWIIARLPGFLKWAGGHVLGWLSHLPGGAGKFFGGLKTAITGGIQALSRILMGLLGGLIQLLMGGDITEAALAAAIGLAMAGSFVNSQTINSAFVTEPQPGGATIYGELIKTAEATNPDVGPSQSISIHNVDVVPKDITFTIKFTAKRDVSNLTCSDELILIKSDKSTENLTSELTLPKDPNNNNLPCPPGPFSSGQEFSVKFTYSILVNSKFNDSILRNTYYLNGNATVAGADYWIPIRDTTVKPFGGNTSALENFKNFVRTNYQNNMIDTDCFGQKCWDFVASQSIAVGVNPTFLLAVWYEESHFSDIGNHFSCPYNITRPHTSDGLRDSLNCFLNIITNYQNDAAGFIAAMNQYCGTGIWEDPNNPTPLCHNNPDFLPQLRSAYQDLGGTVNSLASNEGGQPFSMQATAIVRIGNPPAITTPFGWPTTGYITQTPNEGNHQASDLQAVDIGGSDGNQVCATHDGQAVAYSSGDPGVYGTYGLGEYVAITSTDGSFTSFYGHLRTGSGKSGAVKAGDQIGIVDNTDPTGKSTGPHLHYEFWGLKMEPPNIPETPSDNLHVTGCK